MTNPNHPINGGTFDPQTDPEAKGGISDIEISSINRGLTKREYFAAMAMQGILASFTEKASNGLWGTELDIVAQCSVEAADQLTNALNQHPHETPPLP